MVAKYTNGEPANLEAAARDALTWLQWLDRSRIVAPRERSRLAAAVETLERYLEPALPAEFTEIEDEG